MARRPKAQIDESLVRGLEPPPSKAATKNGSSDKQDPAPPKEPREERNTRSRRIAAEVPGERDDLDGLEIRRPDMLNVRLASAVQGKLREMVRSLQAHDPELTLQDLLAAWIWDLELNDETEETMLASVRRYRAEIQRRRAERAMREAEELEAAAK